MSWYELSLDDHDVTPEHAKSIFTETATSSDDDAPIKKAQQIDLVVQLLTPTNSIKLMCLVFMVLFTILVALILKHYRTS